VVTVRIPAPSRGTVSNLLGLAGFLGVIVAIGALTDWRWALLAASAVAVGLSYLAHLAANPARAVAAPANVHALKPDARSA